MAKRAPSWPRAHVFSIGHSTLTLEEFLARLEAHGVRVLADVRRFPYSPRFPHFNGEALARSLAAHGIDYAHLEKLAGRRRADRGSLVNAGWHNAGFRGYADYLQTKAFREGLTELRALCAQGPVALMCAEAVRWRCHRTLISDALFVRGCIVQHIESATRVRPHVLTPFARWDGRHLTYPPDGPGSGREGDRANA